MDLGLCTALFECGGKLGKDNATKYGANCEDKEPVDSHCQPTKEGGRGTHVQCMCNASDIPARKYKSVDLAIAVS